MVIAISDVDIPSGDDATDRRAEVRIATAVPVLELDGRRIRLTDFTSTGFRAPLPDAYLREGASGTAVLHLQAAGYTVRKTVCFEVRHVRGRQAGAWFETLSTDVQAMDCII